MSGHPNIFVTVVVVITLKKYVFYSICKDGKMKLLTYFFIYFLFLPFVPDFFKHLYAWQYGQTPSLFC